MRCVGRWASAAEDRLQLVPPQSAENRKSPAPTRSPAAEKGLMLLHCGGFGSSMQSSFGWYQTICSYSVWWQFFRETVKKQTLKKERKVGPNQSSKVEVISGRSRRVDKLHPSWTEPWSVSMQTPVNQAAGWHPGGPNLNPSSRDRHTWIFTLRSLTSTFRCESSWSHRRVN